MATRRQWQAFRARVAELEAAGMDKAGARHKAGEEMQARKAARTAELATEKAERSRRALTCQICGRDILADSGLIAHHGYTRPGDGWQTASCPGARELPYENDSRILAPYVVALLEAAERHAGDVVELNAERAPARVEWDERKPGTVYSVPRVVSVTRETFSTIKAQHASQFMRVGCHSFDNAKERTIRDAQTKERFFRSEYKRQKARLGAWRKVKEWDAALGVWKLCDTASLAPARTTV